MPKTRIKAMTQQEKIDAITQIIVDKREEQKGFWLVSVLYEAPEGMGHWMYGPNGDNKILVKSAIELETIRSAIGMLTGYRFPTSSTENGILRYYREK